MPHTDNSSTSPEEKTLFTLEEQSPESKETDFMGNLNFILIFHPKIQIYSLKIHPLCSTEKYIHTGLE